MSAAAGIGAGAGPAGAPSLAEVCAAVHGKALWCPDDSAAVTGVVAADLMSDVLVDAKPGHVLVTGLVTVQAVRTAAIADLAGVVFTRRKAVPSDVVDLARQVGVPVFVSEDTLFEAAGRLYGLLGGGLAGPAARRPA